VAGQKCDFSLIQPNGLVLFIAREPGSVQKKRALLITGLKKELVSLSSDEG
jgi:hypothetical protein